MSLPPFAKRAPNRLVSLKDPARPNGANPSDEYLYDPFGLRYARIETAVDGTRTTTYYLYEGNSILYEETWKNGAKTTISFNLYLGGINIGRYYQAGPADRLQYFYQDHLGSRRAVTNAAGVVEAKIDYTAWGVPTVTNVGSYDGIRDISYTGKEYDASKLYYFNARYYDPSMGRFISEDPARDEMNWYAYCGNNPVSFTDPTGLQLVKEDPNESLSSEDRVAVLEYMNPGATGRAEAKREAIEKAVSAGVEDSIAAAEGFSGYVSATGPSFRAGEGSPTPGPIPYEFGKTQNGVSGLVYGQGYIDPNGGQGTIGLFAIKGNTKGPLYFEGDFKIATVEAAIGVVDRRFTVGAKADGLSLAAGIGARAGKFDINVRGSVGWQAGGYVSVGANGFDFDISAIWGGELHIRW